MPHASVSGRKVYYERHPAREPSDVPPLLLVTGLSGSCQGWLPLQVPDFTAGRETILFDNRGAGESEDPGGPFSISDLAADAVGLLDALDVDQVDVLGAFMGGMIAQEMSLQFARRLRRLVLVGTCARLDGKRRMLLEDWAHLARSGLPLSALTRGRLLWTLQDETFDQTDLVAAMIEFFEKDGSPATADLFARQCDACLGHDTSDRLDEILHPTLVVCGRHDQITPPKLNRVLADGIPDAHLVVLTYGGHLVMAESAERFNHAVLQFLDG